MSIHVLDEANRCLHCKAPQCQKGCPIHTPIPQIIAMLQEGRLDEAGRTLFENNPLTTVCSLVCNHENQCEGHCVLGKKGAPVHFSAIENYISSTYSTKMVKGPAPSNGMRVAIVGSGPAGLTIAVILARYGYQVTIFEGKDKIGGVLRYGIPDFRLPKTVLDDFEDRHLIRKGIRVRPNTTIGSAIGIDDLFRDGYRAIFIGTGVWQPRALHIKGETLGHVHFAINYLNNPDSFRLGERVIVIGAGNAAMDVARTALRKGVRQLTCFSRTLEVAASQHEFSYATLEGVNFEYCKAPVEITDEGVIFVDVREDENGEFIEAPGTEKLYPADSVIVSISQGPRNRIVSTTKGIDTDRRGLLVTDEEGHTTRPGVFASGDVVLGAKTVVQAVAYSKRVAEAMHSYMQGIPAQGDDVAPLRGPDTRLMDLKGRTMLPGFYDCHSHYMRAGMYNALYLDAFAAPIGGLKTLAELAGRIRAGAEKTPKGEWLLCAGYDDTGLAEKRHFSLAELDALVPEHPLFQRHISGHSALCNSLARRRRASARTRRTRRAGCSGGGRTGP